MKHFAVICFLNEELFEIKCRDKSNSPTPHHHLAWREWRDSSKVWFEKPKIVRKTF